MLSEEEKMEIKNIFNLVNNLGNNSPVTVPQAVKELNALAELVLNPISPNVITFGGLEVVTKINTLCIKLISRRM